MILPLVTSQRKENPARTPVNIIAAKKENPHAGELFGSIRGILPVAFSLFFIYIYIYIFR
jgi:hypothetical protein